MAVQYGYIGVEAPTSADAQYAQLNELLAVMRQ